MVEVTLNINSPQGARRVALTGESLSIGRSPASSVFVGDDGGVSREHALIRREGGAVRISDGQSVNGTYVNCELVPPGGTLLADGDEIFVGNHTTMTVHIRAAASARGEAAPDARAAGPPLSLLAVPAVALLVLLAAVLIQGMRGRPEERGPEAAELTGRSDAAETRPEERRVREASPRRAPASVTPTPREAPGPVPRLDEQEPEPTAEATAAPRKLYRRMTDEEKLEFIKERAGRVAVMMGKRPYAFTPDALGYIKFWLDAFAARVGNNRTGLWGGDTRFILARGRAHAPVIVRAFKENRVPPVVGLYIPFIETEFTNIRSNNAAGAAGLFQFLGPTAEHYGVPSSERTDVAKMAPAAARYFRDNIMNFGDDSMSVALAIAGYNRAPESVKRDLRNVLAAASNEDKERNFWTLIANQGRLDHFFQSENKNYVPRFFAAAILGENPSAFGIEMRPLSTYTRVDEQPPSDAAEGQ